MLQVPWSRKTWRQAFSSHADFPGRDPLTERIKRNGLKFSRKIAPRVPEMLSIARFAALKIVRSRMNAEQWKAWFREEERKLSALYLGSPKRLVADFRQERAMMDDYAGRELLEMFQNAADAAAAMDVPAHIRVEITPQGLVIANTGAEFTPDGVESLLMAHVSPKLDSRVHMIGQKGLGFRAMLNWSDAPIVASGSLRALFCTHRTKQVLISLADRPEGSALKALLESEVRHGRPLPVPSLAFPTCAVPGTMESAATLSTESTVLANRCEQILSEGFTTAIGVPWKSQTAQLVAEKQLKDLRAELLLFVSSIKAIEGFIDGTRVCSWSREHTNGDEVLHSAGSSPVTWDVRKKSGSIEGTGEYELALAIPKVGAASPDNLYCYFSTDIPFPLPVVAHATLALEQNRKHPTTTSENTTIFRKLASWLAECAADWQASRPDEPGLALGLVTPRGSWPPPMITAGWVEILNAALKTREIVPCLDGRHRSVSATFRLQDASVNWLPVEFFGDIAAGNLSTGAQSLLTQLGIAELSIAEFSRRAASVKWQTIEERARFIGGMVRHGISQTAHSSSLLLDFAGGTVPPDHRVFLPSERGLEVILPSWAEIRFMNVELRDALTKELGVGDQRELQRQLAAFGVREWALGNVCETLVTAANEAMRQQGSNRLLIATELLEVLAKLFASESLGRVPASFPTSAPIQIPTQKPDVFAPAQSLYVGMGLGIHGDLLQELFGAWAPEKLVHLPEAILANEDVDAKLRFLSWLGVAQSPRQAERKSVEPAFLQHVLGVLKFPLDFDGRVVPSLAQIQGASITSAQSIDGIDGILKNAQSDAILAWLALDSRAAGWKLPASGLVHLAWRPPGAQYPKAYRGPLPHYVRWKLQHADWLVTDTEGREKAMPGKCLAGERALVGLMPQPLKPNADTWARFGIPPESARDAWDRAGVLMGLACASWSEIYQLLMDLPARDPQGAIARSFYRVVMDESESFLGDAEVAGREFRSSGMMFGVFHGQGGYHPVAALRYLTSGSLPEPLMPELRLVAVDRKEGAKKVERIFGIKPIDSTKFMWTVLSAVPHPDQDRIAAEFQDAKPWLWALRKSRDGTVAHRAELERLTMRYCSAVRAKVVHEGLSSEHELAVHEVLRIGSIMYVRWPEGAVPSLASDLVVRRLGDEVAAVTSDSKADDYAWLLRCPQAERQALLGQLIPEPVEVGPNWAPPTAQEEVPYEDPKPSPPGPPVPPASPNPERTPPPKPPQLKGDDLKIEELKHEPAPPAEKSPIWNQSGGGGGARNSGGNREVTDWEYCERIAETFENSAEPRRFAVRVGHITGYAGPRCDVLSLKTEDALKKLLANKSIPAGEVERFIEVKARANERAKIVLKDNALDAARDHAERYYLYRFHEEPDGALTLTIVQNPLSQKATTYQVEVDLDRSDATRWRLSRASRPASDNKSDNDANA